VTDFDEWYTNMATSPVRDEIVQRALGLPPELQSSSLLSWDGLGEVVAALALGPGHTLLDLACGRGGYGLEVARRTGARVVGVDFSAVAVGQARDRAAAVGLADRVEFRVGELTATGLPDACVDAVMCVDAVQFAEPVTAALREIRRVLVPGGPVALTSWAVVDPDADLPQRLLDLDLVNQLVEAGLVEVSVVDRPSWKEAERAMWHAATTVDVGDDPALRSLRDEGRRVLDGPIDATSRVLATARAPR
jgi:ubiquinone/menaquinone biosynthesis C-methylase UbiE